MVHFYRPCQQLSHISSLCFDFSTPPCTPFIFPDILGLRFLFLPLLIFRKLLFFCRKEKQKKKRNFFFHFSSWFFYFNFLFSPFFFGTLITGWSPRIWRENVRPLVVLQKGDENSINGAFDDRIGLKINGSKLFRINMLDI